MSIGIDLSLAPADALNFFRQKGLKASFSWADMMHEEHDAAFTVAKMMDLDLLRDMKSAVDEAIASGETFGEWRKKIQPVLVERGWWGRQVMTDPLTGEEREVQLGSVRRLKLIFRTNLKTSYAAGHWNQIVENAPSAPYLMYDAVDDAETRPEHAQWDGKVFRVDSPFWETWFPPNGWHCRCSVIQIDDEQLRELGKAGPDQPPGRLPTREWTNPRTGAVSRVPVGIDPGWDYHPGRSRTAALREDLAEKAQQIGRDAAPAIEFVERRVIPDLNDAIAAGHRISEEIVGGGASAGVVRERLADRLRREIGEPVAAQLATRGRGADLVRSASRLLPPDWVEATNAHGRLFAFSSLTDRAWHFTVSTAHDGRTFRLPGLKPIVGRLGDGYVRVRDAGSALHEFTHRVQHALPEIDDLFQQLHVRRTRGKPLVDLRELDPSYPVRGEMVPDGGYLHPYFGREYPDGPGLPYRGRAGALEVMPMTFERVLSNDENAFRALLERDRELFDLALGVLFGLRPGGRRSPGGGNRP